MDHMTLIHHTSGNITMLLTERHELELAQDLLQRSRDGNPGAAFVEFFTRRSTREGSTCSGPNDFVFINALWR